MGGHWQWPTGICSCPSQCRTESSHASSRKRALSSIYDADDIFMQGVTNSFNGSASTHPETHAPTHLLIIFMLLILPVSQNPLRTPPPKWCTAWVEDEVESTASPASTDTFRFTDDGKYRGHPVILPVKLFSKKLIMMRRLITRAIDAYISFTRQYMLRWAWYFMNTMPRHLNLWLLQTDRKSRFFYMNRCRL